MENPLVDVEYLLVNIENLLLYVENDRLKMDNVSFNLFSFPHLFEKLFLPGPLHFVAKWVIDILGERRDVVILKMVLCIADIFIIFISYI